MTTLDTAIVMVAAVVATTVIHKVFFNKPESAVGTKRPRTEEPYPGEPPLGNSRVVFGGGSNPPTTVRKIMNEKAIRTVNGTLVYLPSDSSIKDFETSMGKPGALLRVMSVEVYSQISEGFNKFPTNNELVKRLVEIYALQSTEMTAMPPTFATNWQRINIFMTLTDLRGMEKMSMLFLGLFAKLESKDKACLLDCVRNVARPPSFQGKWYILTQYGRLEPERTIDGRDFIIMALRNLQMFWAALWSDYFMNVAVPMIESILSLNIDEGPADIVLLCRIQSTVGSFTNSIWTKHIGKEIVPQEAAEIIYEALLRLSDFATWSPYPHTSFFSKNGELAMAVAVQVQEPKERQEVTFHNETLVTDQSNGGGEVKPPCFNHLVTLLGILGGEKCSKACHKKLGHPATIDKVPYAILKKTINEGTRYVKKGKGEEKANPEHISRRHAIMQAFDNYVPK